MWFSRCYVIALVMFYSSYQIVGQFIMNQTGGSFPNSVYLQSTFAYNFVAPQQKISYFGPSSSVGKCNIEGYWYNLNNNAAGLLISDAVKAVDKARCTDKCTVALCGFVPTKSPTGIAIKPDAGTRLPLVDIAASDGLLKDVDYFNFPDIQMLPAVGGAVVPIYNIPELASSNISTPLILSRSSIVNIFMGFIRNWNDPSIIHDNVANPKVQAILRKISSPLTFVVRTDSSGTSEVFTSGLAAMSPPGLAIGQDGVMTANSDRSFSSQAIPGVTGTTQTPTWCGPLTDEMQYITVAGCNPASASKSLQFKFLDAVLSLQDISFNCDATAATIKSIIFDTTAISVFVAVSDVTLPQGTPTTMITLGYSGAAQQGKNQYDPILVSNPSSTNVVISNTQEGGFVNTVTSCSGAGGPGTAQTMSVFISSSINATFALSWNDATGNRVTASMQTNSINLAQLIKYAINNVTAGAAVTVTKKIPKSKWIEYMIVFSTLSTLQPAVFSTLQPSVTSTSIYVTRFLDYNNYPCFYDSLNPRGFSGSGRYTCYRRQDNFQAFSYFSGTSNPGVVAEVLARPYSIGYSVLEIAIAQSLPVASMINKAGTTVVANSQSVAFAIMDKGGNLDSKFVANLADGSSSSVWPISGFTYFIIRNDHHISPGNCARRSAAMEYLYNYYNSPTVATIATSLGFAALPQFIASIIITRLLDHAKCDDGSYALAKFRTTSTPLLGNEVIASTVTEYLSAYTAVQPSAKFALSYNDDSSSVWNQFLSNPADNAGVFTMFATTAEKLRRYNMSTIITAAFATYAVVPIYHLNDYSNAKSNSLPLQFTAEIIGGILGGKISAWNDPLIKAANPTTASLLPNRQINVVVRGQSTDTNAIILNFLYDSSPNFKSAFIAAGGNDFKLFNFSSVIPKSRLMSETTNDRVDSTVTTFDGSFGYYLQYVAPASDVGTFCVDATCSAGIINPTNVKSINVCESDPNTIINPSRNVYTYNLMSSTTVGCYPIVGTVDYSLLGTTDSKTCNDPKSANYVSLQNRITFSSWLFSSDVVVQPLASNAIKASPSSLRASAFNQICDISCDGAIYGYKYCGYKDCSYENGDFEQVVSPCNPRSETRQVTYKLLNNNCRTKNNAGSILYQSTSIDCTDVQSNYTYGKASNALSICGMVVCAAVFAFVVFNRDEKIIKKSQPVFIYIFIIGAFLMNLSILALIGPNTDHNCLLRPWSINIAVTIMFAPLLMKLHRIDLLFRLSKKLKKTKIPDYKVALQVLGLVMVDVIILLLWTFIERPAERFYNYDGQGLLQSVPYNACNTNLGSTFEQIMVAWKAILLAAGVYKSICTWDKPSDIAEVKHFFLAIYNVSVVGGAMYFFSLYGAKTVGTFVILRTVGIFVSATLPVLIIMVPKFTVIQYKNITGVNLWAARGRSSGSKNESSGSKVTHSLKEIAQGVSQGIRGSAHSVKGSFMLGKTLSASQVIPGRSSDKIDVVNTNPYNTNELSENAGIIAKRLAEELKEDSPTEKKCTLNVTNL